MILFLSISSYNYAQKNIISSITFSGLTKTKKAYLFKLIETKEGQVFDSIQLSRDIHLLKNLNLFFDVSSEIERTNKRVDITIRLKEAYYIYPIVSLSGFKDQLKLRAGINFINFLGRAQNMGFIYQFYGRHSFTLFHSQKRHSNRLTGHNFSVSRNATVEPLYENDTLSFFNFDNNSVSLGGHVWLNDQIKFGIGGQYMMEKYEQLDQGFFIPETTVNFQKYQLRSLLEYNTTQYTYEYIEGTKALLYIESIFTKDHPEASFTKFIAQANHYVKIRERGNFAGKLSMGIATNNISPFSPFVLDGILNIRGIGNRVERGTAEIIANIEYRNLFVSQKYFSIQGAIFADYGTTRMPGSNFYSLFKRDQHYIFTGLGVRFHLKKWFKTCLRLDYSVNTVNIKQHGFTFGFGQFF